MKNWNKTREKKFNEEQFIFFYSRNTHFLFERKKAQREQA